MYLFDWRRILHRSPRSRSPDDDPRSLAIAAGIRPAMSTTVWALGLTSLLTDVSSEMIASVLPAYLVLHLGMSPLAFSVIDGTYQGAAAIARLAGGMLADRLHRHKEVAAAGYVLSAICRPLLMAAGTSWAGILSSIALDRVGKGIRTAPRDALLARSVSPEILGAAFGVHRTMDAAGAMAGPLAAFLLLWWLPDAYDLLFVASFGVALVGVAAIVLLVPARTAGPADTTEGGETVAAAWHRGRDFRALAFAGCLLALGTVSDSFLFLMLQKKVGFALASFPLLYVGTPLVTAGFALACGRLADRHGRARVLLGGYAALGLLYTVHLLPLGGLALVGATVGLLGFHYAATDGVLAAMAAAILPGSRAGSGLGLLATIVNLARFVASLAFGFLWSRYSSTTATASFLAVLILASTAAALLLGGTRCHVPRPEDRD